MKVKYERVFTLPSVTMSLLCITDVLEFFSFCFFTDDFTFPFWYAKFFTLSHRVTT